MRRFAIAFLALAGCGEVERTPDQARQEVFQKEETPSGPSASQNVEQLERWSGKNITLVGTFEHLNFKHGIITLQSGVRVYLPHFDNLMLGDDWFKYIGKKCWASGILHTYTKNIEGYRGPSLELNDFSGP
jgi:hypothetical protein